MRNASLLGLLLAVACTGGCGDDDAVPGTDAGPRMDAATGDGGGADASRPDAAGTDSGPATDSGPIASWAACTVPSECTLAANGCCAPCGAPELIDVDGVAISGIDAHRLEVCPVPTPCPRCPSSPNPWLFSTCGGGMCQALDLHLLSLTECTLDSDCRLRARDCCECGADLSFYNLVAIRSDAEVGFSALVCDPATACPECLPDYASSGSSAHCTAGRCTVTMP